MRYWTDEEKEYLKDITPGKHYHEIAELMNKRFEHGYTLSQIKGAINRYKLHTGFSGHFPKGNVPFNKGKKGLNGKSSTTFKKGHIPKNHKPVGSERMTVDGYTEIKVAEPNRWKMKHVAIWEKVNGPVPPLHVVIFADRNRCNLNLDNLILVSRSELLIMNKKGLIQEDKELTQTGVNVAKVLSKISEIKKR